MRREVGVGRESGREETGGIGREGRRKVRGKKGGGRKYLSKYLK